MAIFLKRISVAALRLAILALIAVSGTLLFAQHSMIYHPHRYRVGQVQETLAKFRGAATLDFTTSQGRQFAYYIAPANGQPPQRIWLAFGGNASRALIAWPDFVAADPKKSDGFLLIDYPGFGQCAGTAEPQNIEESADAAFAQLQQKLANRQVPLCVIGHSLGCATALQFAVKHNVARVILCAPFTSLRDMAQRVVGAPLNYELLHNFDNRARLAELANRHPQPRVFIFHGTADEVIPFRMGKSLADAFPQMITFIAVLNGDHNSILYNNEAAIFRAMNSPANPATIGNAAPK